MATVYKTPGVYVEEISSFPPSVAPVATAIPAFIGYTEKADDAKPGDLVLKPTRISSLVEYQKYFGGADSEIKITVTIDANGKATATLAEGDRSPHIMFYALQMFFANGGGPCYIVSIATYKALDEADFAAGLAQVAKEDEPTLIVFPEAQNLPFAKFFDLHDKALQQ